MWHSGEIGRGIVAVMLTGFSSALWWVLSGSNGIGF